MNLLIGPYFPPEVTANSSGSDAGSNGASRRLAAWVGKAVSLRDAGAGDLPLGTPTLVAAEVQGELVRRVKTLLSKPKFTLARRHARGHRRLLAEPPVEEPANTADGAGSGQLPQLKVGLHHHAVGLVPALHLEQPGACMWARLDGASAPFWARNSIPARRSTSNCFPVRALPAGHRGAAQLHRPARPELRGCLQR